MSGYVTRPLHDRTWLNPAGRKPSRFSASWADTLTLLATEVDALNGRDLVIEADVTEADLRIDGTIRAKARAASPGVIVSFTTRDHGALMYRCDRFVATHRGQPDDWQQNVRAIALTLQALRAVDRYGATSSGEQYAGWRQIESTPAHLDPWAVLERLAGNTLGLTRHQVERRARRNAHPDAGGSHEDWLAYTAAVEAMRHLPGQAAP